MAERKRLPVSRSAGVTTFPASRARTVGPEAFASWAIEPTVLTAGFPCSCLGLFVSGSEGCSASVDLFFPAGLTLNPSQTLVHLRNIQRSHPGHLLPLLLRCPYRHLHRQAGFQR